MIQFKKHTCCVLLCGGLGKRLSEKTKIIPKPMIKVFGFPIIWYVINSLLNSNVEKILLPLGYKGQLIKNYIKKNFKKDREKFLFYNTGKNTSIGKRIEKLKKEIFKYESFFLVNSDTLFNFNLDDFLRSHYKKKSELSISSVNMKSSWGTFFLDKTTNSIKFIKNDYLEGYNLSDKNGYGFRNSGICIIKSKQLNNFNFNCEDFELYIFNKIFKKKSKINLYKFNDFFWHPIENMGDLRTVYKDKFIRSCINKLIKKYKKINGPKSRKSY